MSVTVPTPDQLKQIAEKMGLSLTDGDVASFIALMQPNIEAYNVVDRLPDNLPAVKYPRTPGYRPKPEENEHNAWYYKTRIEGAPRGKLKGKTRGHQGQRDGGRRADDERRLDARGLHARRSTRPS